MTTTKIAVFGNCFLVGGDFSMWERDEHIFDLWRENSPPSASRKSPDLHSSLRFFQFPGNLYTMFVILDIKFRVSNIKWNQCQNTVKFQNMTSLVGKICTNIQTSTDIIF